MRLLKFTLMRETCDLPVFVNPANITAVFTDNNCALIEMVSGEGILVMETAAEVVRKLTEFE